MCCDFFTVPLVGLQCVIVVFPDHTHLPFQQYKTSYKNESRKFSFTEKSYNKTVIDFSFIDIRIDLPLKAMFTSALQPR